MTIVVHISKADLILAVAKDSELPRGRGLHKVGQIERVPGAVDLVRRDGHGEQLRAAGAGDHQFASKKKDVKEDFK